MCSSDLIEVTDDPYLQLAVGKSITNTDHSASAIVENIFRIILNSRPINIVYLSHLFGRFKRGDRLECDVIPQWSAQSPIIIGSLTAITVQGSDGGFTTGQVLDVVGSGISGKARVAATVDENGQVQFELTDGGFGYNYDAEVTIKTSIDIFIHSLAGSFIPGDSVVCAATGANGIVSFSNSSMVQIIDFSGGVIDFPSNSLLNDISSGAQALISSAVGGQGTGASFNIGLINNIVPYTFNTNIIKLANNEQLDNPAEGFSLMIESPTGSFTVANTATTTANTIELEVNYISGSISNGEQLSNTSLGISGITVYRSDGQQLMVTGAQANLITLYTAARPGCILTSSSSLSEVSVIDASPISTVLGTGNVASFSAGNIVLIGSGISDMGYFIPGSIIIDTHTGSSATISKTQRLTNWIL